MEVATSSLRSKLSASFRAWWETASRPLRIFTVGGSTVGVSVLLIQVSGPDRLIFGLMAAGGILLTAAFLLDLYHAALRAWEWPLGKIVGTLGATMVVAVSMALASVTVKEATGIDPEHLSYAVTFLAPLMAGFLLTAGTMLVVVGVFVWFVIESVWGVLRWRFGSGTDAKPVNTDKVLIRLVGVFALALTTAVIFDIGQHSYNGVLTTTARRFTYHFEMYPNDACAFGGERVRRLTDDMVAVGRSTDQGLVFEQRPCALGETAQATLGRESVGTDPSPEAATSPPDGRVDGDEAL
ncbi:TPA: hypothetical protein RNT09_002632 [Stenotrophomonas maltophilia]|jgi:hypothetical protein|uniref:Transmembrane protein n=1 Tax=Stenotrophomonas acidaminiphila TaxID=128780 RepID=A0A0S1AW35_9GAMM|nr:MULTISPECIES: hypothetical protein [Stenotrophomonas]ALJ26984.1 hypothetical protein AOT14_05390 [Stenotrophomonas acidaminiphila]ELE7122643.1 hypothetical protein [Stenotrophomonas maltophilia]HDS1605816.1 hypothetical protein [Stenotrophomonas maltophilia]HDS3803169.1 hypothetical protein [Stenotrophomonas maltophilia]HDX0868697.1 hypothetical protein [Stenotrophomonas maltophilia]